MKIQRSVESTASVADAYAFLSDFTTTEQWDPGTVTTERISGDGGVGTRYRNVSEFNGRESELVYEVVEDSPPVRYVVRGEGRSATAEDVMEFEELPGGGSRVTYTADIRLKGLLRLAEPFLSRAFTKLGDDAEAGLRAALGGLGQRD